MKQCIILGDVTYGACCIDDITASMLGAQLLVHYGHSCLVPVGKTVVPCLYVFVGLTIDAPHLVSTIEHNLPAPTPIVLAGTIQFSSAVQQASRLLREHQRRVTVPQAKPLSAGEVLGCTAPSLEPARLRNTGHGSDGRQPGAPQSNRAKELREASLGPLACANGKSAAVDRGGPHTLGEGAGAGGGVGGEARPGAGAGSRAEAGSGAATGSETGAEENGEVLVFVADGRFHLEAMMIANPDLVTYRYDPFTRNLLREEYDHRGMRRARRSAVQKAERAQQWGVVLGTLGRQGNTATLDYVCQLLRSHGRHATVFLVSELSPAKVAHFEGVIEAWVQIACPRLSIDWGEAFCAPLLTPYEVTVALGKAPKWWREAETSLQADEAWTKIPAHKAHSSEAEGERKDFVMDGFYPMDYYAKQGLGSWSRSVA